MNGQKKRRKKRRRRLSREGCLWLGKKNKKQEEREEGREINGRMITYRSVQISNFQAFFNFLDFYYFLG